MRKDIFLIAIFLLGLGACMNKKDSRPNIILIYADDLDIGMLGC